MNDNIPTGSQFEIAFNDDFNRLGDVETLAL
jgi:hypothetical protein